MKILDLSCGKRLIWYDSNHPDCTYIDIRSDALPDIVVDSRDLSLFYGQLFDLFVFDPPHVNTGAKSRMSERYGHFTTEVIRDTIRRTSAEAHKIAHPNALMAFKWNTNGMSLAPTLDLMSKYWEPLFGHAIKKIPGQNIRHVGVTSWIMLKKRGND